MFSRFRLPVVVGSGILLLVLLLVFGSLALAQNINRVGVTGGENQVAPASISAVPGGPGFVSMSGAAFTAESSTDRYSISANSLYNLEGWGTYLQAPLQLPNRATITKLVVYYYDNVIYEDMTVGLARAPLDSISLEVMATLNPSGAANFFRYEETSNILTPVIDQQSYSYMILLILPGNTDVKITGVRVDYAFPSQLPLINK
jgi:hypothetical protein